MPAQVDISDKGGTMRLGVYPCKLKEDTKAFDVYGEHLIYERHRHRWEFNNKYRTELSEAGLVISGTSPDDRLVEIVEIKDHPGLSAASSIRNSNPVRRRLIPCSRA